MRSMTPSFAVDDVDFLAELIVGEEGDLRSARRDRGFHLLDQAVVVNTTVGVFGEWFSEEETLSLGRGGLGVADDGGRERRSQHERTPANAVVS